MFESSNDVRQLITRLPIAAALNALDESQTILVLNDQFIRTFGYTLDDIPTVRDWAAKAYPDRAYRQQVFTAWDAAVVEAQSHTGRVEAMVTPSRFLYQCS